MELTYSSAERGRRHRPRQLPERRSRAGTPRGYRQPASRAGARVGRGHRREPPTGHGGPSDPGQHHHRRVLRSALRGQPACPADQRRPLPVRDSSNLPEPADLAVVAVPATSVLDVAEQCGQRGVRSLVVIASGLDAAASADLLAVCRRHGIRLIGPNCFGVAVPAIGLDATFGTRHPQPGVAGLVMQSGGLGFAMVDQLSRLGIGISSFVSVGNKLDVSSNDMLMWWEHDGVTRLAVLYIESFGNPRKFVRTARRVGAAMPVLAAEAGRSAAGLQAAASHTAAVATPIATREALCEQAGVITTSGFGELVETAALLG